MSTRRALAQLTARPRNLLSGKDFNAWQSRAQPQATTAAYAAPRRVYTQGSRFARSRTAYAMPAGAASTAVLIFLSPLSTLTWPSASTSMITLSPSCAPGTYNCQQFDFLRLR